MPSFFVLLNTFRIFANKLVLNELQEIHTNCCRLCLNNLLRQGADGNQRVDAVEHRLCHGRYQ